LEVNTYQSLGLPACQFSALHRLTVSCQPTCLLQACLSTSPLIYLSIYPSIYKSIYLSIYLSIHLSIHLSIYPSVYKSIYLSIYISIYLSIHLSVDLIINLFAYITTYVTIYLFIYLSTCVSMYLSIYLSIYLSNCVHVSIFVPLKHTLFCLLTVCFMNLIYTFVTTVWTGDCPVTMPQPNPDNTSSDNYSYRQWNLNPVFQCSFGRTQHSPLSTAGCRCCT
jgi:hypothetical protein